MLENTNDYISLIVIIFFLAATIWLTLYVINLKKIEANIKEEVKYYDYDKRKQSDITKQG